MARSRRRTRWVDALRSDVLVLAGAAAPGSIVDEALITETEMEQELVGGTIIRVVGSIFVLRTAGSPVVTAAIWMAPTYVGSVLPSDWTNDTFNRPGVMYTEMWNGASVGTPHENRTVMDVRSKRKIEPGKQLLLSLQNHRVAGHDAQVTYHLRMLVLMP